MMAAGGVSVAAVTDLHFAHGLHGAHGDDGAEEALGDAALVLHRAVFPHDRDDYDSHGRDHEGGRDGGGSDHGPEDHASHGHGFAAPPVQAASLSAHAPDKPLRVFEADILLPEPLYLTEHIPD